MTRVKKQDLDETVWEILSMYKKLERRWGLPALYVCLYESMLMYRGKMVNEFEFNTEIVDMIDRVARRRYVENMRLLSKVEKWR